jgi:hypothetical protein
MSYHYLPTQRRNFRRLTGKWWGTAIAAMLVLSCHRTAFGNPTLADWIPSTAVAYVSASDVQSLDTRWKASHLGQFWNHPDMEPFRDSLRAARGMDDDESVAWYGLTWDDLQKVASGPAALAVAPVGEDSIGFLLLVDVNDRGDAAQAALDALVAKMQAAGAEKRMEDLHGLSVTALNLESGEAEKQATQRYCFLDDRLLIISDQRPLIEQALILRGGSDQKSLAQTTEYQTVSARVRQATGSRTVDLCWYMTPIQYADLLVAAGVSQPNKDWQLLRPLGFEVFQAVGGDICLSAGDRELESFTVIYAPGALEKAAQWLSLRPLGEIAVPDWIPDHIANVTQWNWDHAAAFSGYGHWFDAKYAEGEEGVFDDVLLDVLEESDGPKVDVRKELIEQFVSPTTVATFSNQSEDSVTDIRMVATPVKDSTTVARAVQRMLEGDPDVRSEQLDGQTAWVFRELKKDSKEAEPEAPVTMLGPDLSRVAVLVTKGALLAASDVAILQDLFRKKLAPLNQLQDYQRVASEIKQRAGEGLVGWRFSHPRRGWRASYELMRAGSPPDANSMTGFVLGLIVPPSADDTDAGSNTTNVDYTLLPTFQKLEQFLLPLGFWAETIDNGWLIVGFAHKPSSDESEQ